MKGGLERPIDVEVLFPKKTKTLPQLGLPSEEVEPATNPAIILIPMAIKDVLGFILNLMSVLH